MQRTIVIWTTIMGPDFVFLKNYMHFPMDFPVATVLYFLHLGSESNKSKEGAWWVCMTISNNFIFSTSLLLYHREATDFSHTIMWLAPPEG